MATNIDNLKSQMRKGMLEFCVLLLLQHEDCYASEIIERMKEAHLIVMEGTLYPLLTRLKNDEISFGSSKEVLQHHSCGTMLPRPANVFVE